MSNVEKALSKENGVLKSEKKTLEHKVERLEYEIERMMLSNQLIESDSKFWEKQFLDVCKLFGHDSNIVHIRATQEKLRREAYERLENKRQRKLARKKKK